MKDQSPLVKFSQSSLMLADPDEDIRGRTVMDQSGEKIGRVDDLMVDFQRKVRFLQVGSGGFLGLGRDHVLIPVEAISFVTEDEVQLNQNRQHIGQSPEYSPELISNEEFYQRVYAHYGTTPFWSPGYVSPIYPYYRRPPTPK